MTSFTPALGDPAQNNTGIQYPSNVSTERQIGHNGRSFKVCETTCQVSEFSKPEEVVRRILQIEICEYENEMLESESDPFLAELLKKEDSEWEKQEKLYLKIEKWIRENSDKIPTWEVTGPLHYGMSLNKMKEVIKQKFRDMASSGHLMVQKSLDETHDRTNFYPTLGRGGNNMTRIWGAEFLKSNLLDDTTLRAADHFLIVDDEASEIEVEVWHEAQPHLYIVNNAHILSKKIEGDPQAGDYRFSNTLDKLGYRDFKNHGNIIRDSNGIGWIVDTELNSFDAPHLTRSACLIQNYLKKRFEILCGENYNGLYQTFKISVSELDLK